MGWFNGLFSAVVVVCSCLDLLVREDCSSAEPFFVVFRFRQESIRKHTCETVLYTREALGCCEVCCYCIYSFRFDLDFFFEMLEIEEDAQLGFESEEDDDELSDSEVRKHEYMFCLR